MATMGFNQTVKTFRNTPWDQSIILDGPHGIGKSQTVYQIAKMYSLENKMPFHVIELRVGQYDIGDLIGLPQKKPTFEVTRTAYQNGVLIETKETVKNVTIHNLPQWFPMDPDFLGFLFLDEFNRGSRETMQWSMQLILDRVSNFHKLPKYCKIAAAINEDINNYNVHPIDHACFDRFMYISFLPLLSEWVTYAKSINMHPAIIQYCEKNPIDLYPPKEMEYNTKYPSPRSWEKLSNTLKHWLQNGNDFFKEDEEYQILLCSGFVGFSVANNFINFVKNEFKNFSPEQILNNFPEIREEFQKLNVLNIPQYSRQLVEYFNKEGIQEFTKKQQSNLISFLKVIPREMVPAFWETLLSSARPLATKWYSESNQLSKLITEAFAQTQSKNS